MEIFKDIKDFKGLYQVSNMGRIKSLKLKKEKILKPNILKTGYCIVHLCKDKKRYAKTVHRLVAEHFLKNKNNYDQVNHKDGNKKNNVVENLEWCNESINILHSYRNLTRKIHPFTKKVLCLETNEIFNSISEASKNKKIKSSCISHVINGRAKTAGGYKWKQVPM